MGGCNCNYQNNECDESNQNDSSILDPNGDNWCYNKDDCLDVNYYKQYNGTEGNADLGRYPDTEDLDKDYNLDTSNNYFTTTIDPITKNTVDNKKIHDIQKLAGKPIFKVNNIMILGLGKIGRLLAKSLQVDYNVKVIEINENKAKKYSENLDECLILVGDGLDIEFLESENKVLI